MIYPVPWSLPLLHPRYTEKNLWIDPKSNISYGVQVEVPENQMTSMNDINEIPVLSNESRPVLGDVAM